MTDTTNTQQTNSDCLSELVLDRWFHNEGSHSERESWSGHINSCSFCSSQVANREKESQVFAAEKVSLEQRILSLSSNSALSKPLKESGTEEQQLSQAGISSIALEIKRFFKQLWTPVRTVEYYRPIGAVASLMLVVVISFVLWKTIQTERTALNSDLPGNWINKNTLPQHVFSPKGSLKLNVYADHSEGGKNLSIGDSVRPGDRIKFSVSVRKPGYLMIIGVDETKKTFLYYPNRKHPRAKEIKPGKEQVLPGAIKLDKALGIEWVIALKCREEFGFQEAKQSMGQATASMSEWKHKGVPKIFSACDQSAFYFVKK